jgi:hypothetical protein
VFVAPFNGLGIRLVGTDGWSWLRRSRSRVVGDYSHLEKLQNLEMLPADGFEIVYCPVEVHRASAGWTRAVTILPA